MERQARNDKACAVLVDESTWRSQEMRVRSLMLVLFALLAMTSSAAADPPKIVKIVAGPWQACALASSGNLYCWQVAFPDRHFRLEAKRVTGVPALKDLDIGAQGLSCGIDVAGSLICWHSYFEDAAGGYKPSSVYQRSPFTLPIAKGHALTRVAVGFAHVCALDAGGDLWCAGNNSDGELGTGDSEGRDEMRKVPGLPALIAFDAGINNTCAISRPGDVWCWGTDSPVANHPMIVNSKVPLQITGPKSLLQIQDGRNSMCAISSEPSVYCWGDNILGQLGVPNAEMKGRLFAVVDRPMDQPVLSLSSGMFSSCIVLQDGAVECWGVWGPSGPTASGVPHIVYDPQRKSLPLPARSVAVSSADDKACALLSDGSIWCWGYKRGSDMDAKPPFVDEPWQIMLPEE